MQQVVEAEQQLQLVLEVLVEGEVVQVHLAMALIQQRLVLAVEVQDLQETQRVELDQMESLY